MKTVSLSRKFFRWILFAATVPTITLTIVYLASFKSALLQHEIEDLSLIADTKLEQIEGYIDTAIIDSRLLSNSLSTVEAIKVLTPLYKNSAKGTDQFSKIEASFHKYFQSFHDRGYYDIFLVTPKGDVILTLVHEKDFATNIFTGPYRDSGLSHVVKRSIFLMESGTSSFEYYKPSGEAAAFIATPVLVAGQLIGVVVIQIDTSIVQKISVELGDSIKSREVLIGAKKGKTFSFQSPVKFGPQFEVGKEMALHKKTGPLINAMKGVTGITFDTDYRGIETIAASRYIPSLNWGMAVKEDLDEV
ncbi:MAG: cache domain-containing protein, partial [Gammaproteobacteria bacterium]|nr:cache domain-containing protein [Gammaproteobacteria bacterium]